MSFKYLSYGGIEDIGRTFPAMDRDNIIDAPSIDGISEGFRDPQSESSSPGNGSSSFGHSTPEYTSPRDVWLGQKYLESIIALQLHSQAGAEDTVPGLESKFKANLQDFPFSQCCAYLLNNGANGSFDPGSMTTNYRKTLLSWVGHVIREGLAAEENLVRNAISSFVNTNPLVSGFPRNQSPGVQNESPTAHNTGPHRVNGGSPSIRNSHQTRQHAVPTGQSGHPPTQNGSTPRQNGSPVGQNAPSIRSTGSPPGQSRHPPTQNGSTSTQNGNPIAQNAPSIRSNGSPPAQGDLSRYTSLLKEKGDYYEETPIWIDSDISTNDHPCFRCIVTFQDVTAEGTGRQKRFARHEASFQACQQLGFQLS